MKKLALTVALVPGVARLVRSVILTVSEEDYVEAARAYGASNFRILQRYIVPNAMGTIIISTTINISYMILSAAGQYEILKGGDWHETLGYGSCGCAPGLECGPDSGAAGAG